MAELSLDEIHRWWPELGTISTVTAHGSGQRLVTSTGIHHLKSRPRARIRVEMWVLDELTRRGVPVTRPVPTLTGATHLITDECAWFCYTELPGAPLWNLVGPDADAHARANGRACAELALVLADLDITTAVAEGLPVRDNPRGCAGQQVQVIHRDFHAGNVLHDEAGQISGYIDFDHLELGPRLVDLVYMSTSLLARMDEIGAADQWLSRWEHHLAGYLEVSPLTGGELGATVELMLAVEEDFAHFFVEIDDADNLTFTHRLMALVSAQSDQILAITKRVSGLPDLS